MKLNVKAFSLAAGILWGIAVFFLTIWFICFGYDGNTLSLLGKIYLGYSVTWGGAFIGLIWGFVEGVICGAIFTCLYNKFVK
ncbi:MAG: bacteriophage holin [Bacteroidetes bacterium]|nr:bacteriophage holin [Bacteroidota bacterium]